MEHPHDPPPFFAFGFGPRFAGGDTRTGPRAITSSTSTVHISGSGYVNFLQAYNSSTVAISGGSVGVLHAENSSAVDISGGSVVDLYANDTTTVTFHARDFSVASGLSLDGDRVQGTGILSGEWFDGSLWTTYIGANVSGATILALPEPATLSLLAVGGLVALRRRRVAQRTDTP